MCAPSAAVSGYTLDAHGMPDVVLVSALSGVPTPNTGWKATVIIGYNSTTSAALYPVLKAGGYTYWTWSDINNGSFMDIAVYDSSGNFVQDWPQSGDRYIWQITTDYTTGTISLWGQSSNTTPLIPPVLWSTIQK